MPSPWPKGSQIYCGGLLLKSPKSDAAILLLSGTFERGL